MSDRFEWIDLCVTITKSVLLFILKLMHSPGAIYARVGNCEKFRQKPATNFPKAKSPFLGVSSLSHSPTLWLLRVCVY